MKIYNGFYLYHSKMIYSKIIVKFSIYPKSSKNLPKIKLLLSIFQMGIYLRNLVSSLFQNNIKTSILLHHQNITKVYTVRSFERFGRYIQRVANMHEASRQQQRRRL